MGHSKLNTITNKGFHFAYINNTCYTIKRIRLQKYIKRLFQKHGKKEKTKKQLECILSKYINIMNLFGGIKMAYVY